MTTVITRIGSLAEMPNGNLGVAGIEADGAMHVFELSPEAQRTLRLPFPLTESVLPMFRIHLRSGVTLDLPAGLPELKEVSAALAEFLQRG